MCHVRIEMATAYAKKKTRKVYAISFKLKAVSICMPLAALPAHSRLDATRKGMVILLHHVIHPMKLAWWFFKNVPCPVFVCIRVILAQYSL